MKIKRRLGLIFFTITGLFFAVSVNLYLASKEFDRVDEKLELLNTLSQKNHELDVLTYEFLLYPGQKRISYQWERSYQAIAGILEDKTSIFKEQAELPVLESIKKETAGMRKHFLRLADLYDAHDAGVAVVSDLERRLVARMLVYSRQAVSSAGALHLLGHQQHSRAQLKADILTVIMLALSLAIVLSAWIVARRSISQPITNLIRGAGLVAQGDLEHKIDIQSKDEIGALSEAFNDMTRQLKISYSKLEDEVKERKKVHNELQKYREQLELRVEERTADLKDANLRLKELDRLKSMFIASMSHELRTPLNSIIGFSGLLLQGIAGDLNTKQKDSMERIHRSGKHLLGLVSDVIDISKVEAGRIDVFPEHFPLKELVDEAVEGIRPLADKKGLALEVQADAWPEMNTDRKRLLQCLLNYLSNAVKFTETGKVSLLVSVNEDMADIRVTDTGIGIAEDDFPKLFEAFERLETHLRIKAGGTGLGLYLTKKITEELLHGDVSVESRHDDGSIFGLSIPINIINVDKEDSHDG
ncbi:MAG: HAMP domain-containing protein [Gammaproteobacteria bacterium]|nr:HAMP domain-containing protein [Gammaproteobacteria bacterium]